MTDLILKALEFGVLGLCAITLILVWRILQTEQQRKGTPRKGILRASYIFMAFSIILALFNSYVQLRENEISPDIQDKIETLEVQLRTKEDQLLKIQSAAAPILTARSNIIENLPPGPEKNTLATLVDALRDIME